MLGSRRFAKAVLASLLGFSIVSGELAIIERVASAAPPKQIDPMSVKGLPDPGVPTQEFGEPNRNSFEQQPKFGALDERSEIQKILAEKPTAPTVVDSLTTPDTLVTVQPDGSITKALTTGPVRAKDAQGKWRGVDLSLVDDGKGTLTQVAGPTDVKFSSRAESGKPIAEVVDKKGRSIGLLPTIALRQQDATRVTAEDLAKLSGKSTSEISKLTDPKAIVATKFAAETGGTSVEVAPTKRGFESTYSFASLTEFPSDFTERLALPAGWSARDNGNGSIQLVDDAGTDVGAWAGGEVTDSKVVELGSVRDSSWAALKLASVDASKNETVVTATVVTDAKWIGDAARVWPVRVDPVVTVFVDGNGSSDTKVSSANPTTAYPYTGDLQIGLQSAGSVWRSLVQWNVADFRGLSISAASIQMYGLAAGSCTNQLWAARRIASPWAETLNWNDEQLLSIATPDAGDLTSSVSAAGCTTGYSLGLPVTSTVASWASGTNPNYGLLLVADETQLAPYKQFASYESIYANTEPALVITYTNSTTPVSAQPATPADKYVTVAPTLTLTATAASGDTDPGMSYQYWFRVATGSDGESGSVVWNTGWQTGLSTTVPDNVLTNGQTYYWKIYTYDQVAITPYGIQTGSAVWSFRFDMRLGASPSASDSFGPFTTNLATGNLYSSFASPSMSIAGGALGVSIAYNSQTPANTGLRAAYMNDAAQDHVFNDTPLVSTVEQKMEFNWGVGSPSPVIQSDHFLADYKGYLTAPESGDYEFWYTTDDRLHVYINTGMTSVVEANSCTCGAGLVWGGAIFTLTAGQPIPIEIQYEDETGGASFGLYIVKKTAPTFGLQPIPFGWLTQSVDVLPKGWNLTADADLGLTYTKALYSADSIVLTSPDSQTQEFKKAVGTGGAVTYLPPTGNTDILSTTVVANGIEVKVDSADGYQYKFDYRGALTGVVSTEDDLHPSAPTLTYDPVGTWNVPARLTRMTDPVSQNYLAVHYGGEAFCSYYAPPSGYVNPPSGQICGTELVKSGGSVIADSDMHLYVYPSSNQIASIQMPGSARTDLSYDSNGSLNFVKDATAFDNGAAVNQGYFVTYDGSKRVTNVHNYPIAGYGYWLEHNYAYAGTLAGLNATTTVNTGVATPSGFVAKYYSDASGRPTRAIAQDGTETQTTWDVQDRVLATQSQVGASTLDWIYSSTLYDSQNRVTDTYGPAPIAKFNTTTRVPVVSGDTTVPHTHSNYEEGMNGFAVAYYDTPNWSDKPKYHQLGFNGNTSDASANWGASAPHSSFTSADNWSARGTALLNVTTFGSYDFYISVDDVGRLYLDDTLLVEQTSAGTSPVLSRGLTVGDHRIRFDYAENTGGASFGIYWRPTGGGAFSLIPGSSLKPGYGLSTSSVTNDSGGTGDVTTTTSYANPVTGLVTSTSIDPAGLNLTSSTTYENYMDTGAAKWMRPLTNTLPAGNGYTSIYYGDTEVATNLCTGASASQAGRLKTRQNPQGQVHESVYDDLGRVVASRLVGDGNIWTCVSYDSRGRVVTTTIGNTLGTGKRVITNAYTYGTASPLTTYANQVVATELTDGVQTSSTTSRSDMWGRGYFYQDNTGNQTTTLFDQWGRVASTATPGIAASSDVAYNNLGQVTQQRLWDTATSSLKVAANPLYRADGKLASVNYPSGAWSNNTNTTLGYDTYGRLISKNNGTGPAVTPTWFAQDLWGYSQNNRVNNEQLGEATLVDHNTGSNDFSYDKSGRLTQAIARSLTGSGAGSSTQYDYSFAASSGCPSNVAYKNSNRTSMTSTPSGGSAANTTYCYDSGDRMQSTTASGFEQPGYDSHGNTTQIGTGTAQAIMSYDFADRHTKTDTPDGVVSYARDASDRILQRDEWTKIRNISNTTAANSSSGATTLVMNKPANVIANDQLIASIVTRTGSSTFTLPSGWVQITSATTSGGATTAAFRHTVATGDPSSWTWTINSSVVASGSIVAYRGVNPAVPVTATTAGVVTASNSSSTSSLAINSGNTLNPGSPYSHLLMISGVKSGSTTTPVLSSPSGMTTSVTSLSNGTTKVSVQTAELALTSLGLPGAKSFTYAPSSYPAGIGIILNPVPSKTSKYVYTGSSDSPSATLNGVTVVEKTYSLAGGTLCTDRTPSGGTKVFSYTGLGGSVAATRDAAGAQLTARSYYGPFGETSNAYPDNADGQTDFGWKGEARKSTEHSPGMPTMIEMGARLYSPALGRFLEVDPVEGGASYNNYSYVNDPVNLSDLNGKFRSISKVLATIRYKAAGGLGLPTEGDHPYIPPKRKGGSGKPVRKKGTNSVIDGKGNVWEPQPNGHGGPHWDVQHPDGTHTNVGEQGQVTHGPDNFPGMNNSPQVAYPPTSLSYLSRSNSQNLGAPSTQSDPELLAESILVVGIIIGGIATLAGSAA